MKKQILCVWSIPILFMKWKLKITSKLLECYQELYTILQHAIKWPNCGIMVFTFYECKYLKNNFLINLEAWHNFIGEWIFLINIPYSFYAFKSDFLGSSTKQEYEILLWIESIPLLGSLQSLCYQQTSMHFVHLTYHNRDAVFLAIHVITWQMHHCILSSRLTSSLQHFGTATIIFQFIKNSKHVSPMAGLNA